MVYNRKTRRAFLKGAGGLFFALPFYPAFLDKAFAQTTPSHLKRMICIFINSGSGEFVWFPQVPENTLTTKGLNYKARSMVDIWNATGKVSPIFDDPRFSKYAKHLSLYRGLDTSVYSGHQKTVPFTGHCIGDRHADAIPMNASVDFLVSRAAHIYPTEPHSKLAVFGIAGSSNNWNGPTTTFSENSAGVISPIPPILNPMAAWDYYFKGLVLSDDNSGAEIEKIRLKNKSILDTVMEDYKRLIGSRNLANSEKQSLESHLDLFRDLEKKINNIKAITCSSPTRATQSMFKSRSDLVARGEFRSSSDLPIVMDLMIDIVATAMRCQLTNVATIMLEASNLGFDFLKIPDGHRLSHSRVHSDDNSRKLANDQTKLMQSLMIGKVLNLVEKLDIPDPTNSSENMLDNTLIFGSNELGSVGNHRSWSLPVFTIGGGKKINAGWYIDYRTKNKIQSNYGDSDISPSMPPAYHGRDYNGFLMGIMMAMGLKPSDWERNGVPGFGSYRFTKNNWYGETENPDGIKHKGIITPGKRTPPPFMLKS